jgi:hypothetical protein
MDAMGIRHHEKEERSSAIQEKAALGRLYKNTFSALIFPQPEYCARRVTMLVKR